MEYSTYNENITNNSSSSPISAALSYSLSAASSPTGGSSPTSADHHHQLSSPPPPPPQVVLSPCAACKILRRRCVDKCVLAPYFPPTEPLKFTIAHKVFGASNIIKLLQELPETHRADAVNSLVYEANARIRDPIYGCAGAICQLQKQISELQAELAKAKAEILNMQCQNADLVTLICMEMSQHQESSSTPQWLQESYHNDNDNDNNNTSLFLDDGNLGVSWEPLWA